MNDRAGEDGIDVRTITVGRQPLCVATTRGPEGRPPLLMFNGIGANWQLAKPFLHALTNTAAIIFDVISGGKVTRLFQRRKPPCPPGADCPDPEGPSGDG